MNVLFKKGIMDPERTFPEIPLLRVITGAKFINWQPVLLWVTLLSMWFLIPVWLRKIDPQVAIADQGIWMLIILSMIAFLMILALSMWLLQLFWLKTGLPPLSAMVSQFKTLTLWQQLVSYWASFVLLLLAALGCLTAIC